jgi:hypothetical protein
LHKAQRPVLLKASEWAEHLAHSDVQEVHPPPHQECPYSLQLNREEDASGNDALARVDADVNAFTQQLK